MTVWERVRLWRETGGVCRRFGDGDDLGVRDVLVDGDWVEE